MKIYLAIPYTGIEEESFNIANKVAARLIEDGHIVFSPISHSHSISKHITISTWELWKKQDFAFIDWCDCIVVVVPHNNGLHYVDNSVGVQAEIQYAVKLNKIINFINEIE